MENKNLIKVKKIIFELNILTNELLNEKEKVSFNKILIEYKKNKKIIKKTGILIEKTGKSEERTATINDAKKVISIILIKLKKVENIERKILTFRKNINGLIMSVDTIKNRLEFNVEKSKLNITSLENSISKNHFSNLEKKLNININLLSDIDKKIKSSNDKREPINIYRYELKKIKVENNKINLEIKKINNINFQKIEKKILTLKQDLSINIKLLNFEKENISTLLNLIIEIKNSLSFRDADEIKDNLSFDIKYLNVWYGNKQALFDINMEIPKKQVIAVIGPSGCGKSTFLRTLNRINDNIPSFKARGRILLDGEYDIFKLKSIINRYDKMEISTLRTKVGMIFQQPNPFPMSIFKNVTYGPKVRGVSNKIILNKINEKSLRDAGLWEEVKDNLKALGTSLSGGQQQRLCIARAIANQPEILLMDEPTSALDPKAAKKVEELIVQLKENYTIIMVTHSMQQAQRISDMTAFFYKGKLIEYDTTKKLFSNPKEIETKEYISGKFG